MSLLEDFKIEFNKRHDFYSDELNILFNRWKDKTNFRYIPEAWIIPIDLMLEKLKNINIFPSSVEQEFGQLLVLYKESEFPEDGRDREIIETAKNEIKLIDEDLYLFLDIDERHIEFEFYKKYFSTNQLYN